VISFTPQPFHHRSKKGPRCPLRRSLGVPQTKSWRCEKEKILYPKETQTPASRHSNPYAVSTALPRVWKHEHNKETICHIISQLSWAVFALSCKSTSTSSKAEILPSRAVARKKLEAISYHFLSRISKYYNKDGTIKYAKYAGVLNFIVSNLIPFNQTMNVRYTTSENFLQRTSKFCYSQTAIWGVQHCRRDILTPRDSILWCRVSRGRLTLRVISIERGGIVIKCYLERV
jgi:hypothetical protein